MRRLPSIRYEGCARPEREYGRSAHNFFYKVSTVFPLNNEASGEVYNLQGQRVKKAQKGLYIVNGKKFINK